MSRKTSLPITWPVHQWLAADPHKRRLTLSLNSHLAWQALWGSVNWRLSLSILKMHAEFNDCQIPDPILIVGPWRSGTTLMHELLVAATGFPTPLTWQCMNAPSFLLTGRRTASRSAKRPMDGIIVHDQSPQEDEFALLSLGTLSAYHSFLMPHRITEMLPTLDQNFWLADDTWFDTWIGFLKGVVSVFPRTHLPLILKSPNHTYRLKAILQRFPRAKVVWMYRDPMEIFHSNRKMWQQIFQLYGLSESKSEELDVFLAHALNKAAETLRWCDKTLPADQFVVVRLEDLQTAADHTVRGVLETFSLGNTISDDQLSTKISSMKVVRRESYEGHLPPLSNSAIANLREAHIASRRFSSI